MDKTIVVATAQPLQPKESEVNNRTVNPDRKNQRQIGITLAVIVAALTVVVLTYSISVYGIW